MKIETARFTRMLGTLLKSGVPVLGALAVVGEMMANQVARARGRRAWPRASRRGAGLAGRMREHGVFPPLAVHMVRVGEETGRLEEMLLKVAADFEADVRTAGQAAHRARSSPPSSSCMGVLVGFIVVAMLLAIFSITEIPL